MSNLFTKVEVKKPALGGFFIEFNVLINEGDSILPSLGDKKAQVSHGYLR